jgi:hypothetical protein
VVVAAPATLAVVSPAMTRTRMASSLRISPPLWSWVAPGDGRALANYGWNDQEAGRVSVYRVST